MSIVDKTVIAPSLLASDFAHLANAATECANGGAEYLHFDVMDGRFVPEITFGSQAVRSLRMLSQAFFDVHLMIVEPEKQIQGFADAGANGVTVHLEACTHLHRTLQHIRDLGMKAGVAVNPHTPVSALEFVMELTDLILVMTVNPGYGGQSFIPAMLPKIREAKQLAARATHPVHVEVDGGISPYTAGSVAQAGASALVAGTAIFGAKGSTAEAIAALRTAAIR